MSDEFRISPVGPKTVTCNCGQVTIEQHETVMRQAWCDRCLATLYVSPARTPTIRFDGRLDELEATDPLFTGGTATGIGRSRCE